MPAQTSKNPIADKLAKKGLGKSLAKHGGDETEYGKGGDLPAGVIGIAELVEAKLGEYKTGQYKGEPFVYLAGVVITPSMFNGIPVEGLRTSLTLRLSDDKPGQYAKTFDERVALMLNELRKLGSSTTELTSEKDLEDTLNALVSEKVQFKFRTWASEPTKQYPNPRTNHVWDGAATGPTVSSETTAVEDNTEASTETGGEAAGDDTDWAALGEAADAGDQDAIAKITEALTEQGMSEDDINSVVTWAEAAGMVGGGGEVEAEPEAEAEATPWKPAKGDAYPIKPKGEKKLVDCEVTAVYKATLDLKELGGKKRVFKNIPWGNDPDQVGGIPVGG